LIKRFPIRPQLLRGLDRCRPERRKEAWMSILWIILIVVLVLALLGFFGFR
jgi:flagellar basal body-associated protein FliL